MAFYLVRGRVGVLRVVVQGGGRSCAFMLTRHWPSESRRRFWLQTERASFSNQTLKLMMKSCGPVGAAGWHPYIHPSTGHSASDCWPRVRVCRPSAVTFACVPSREDPRRQPGSPELVDGSAVLGNVGEVQGLVPAA